MAEIGGNAESAKRGITSLYSKFRLGLIGTAVFTIGFLYGIASIYRPEEMSLYEFDFNNDGVLDFICNVPSRSEGYFDLNGDGQYDVLIMNGFRIPLINDNPYYWREREVDKREKKRFRVDQV